MDIRGRCCPFQNKKEFLKCGAMLDTAFFHFENDYDIYKQLEATENSDYEKIIKAFLKKIGIKEWSWFKRFTYMFIEKYNEDNEITQVKDNIKELKDLLVKVEKFDNKREKDLWYVKEIDDIIEDYENYEFKKEFNSWYYKMISVYDEFDNKINNKQRTNNKEIENEIKELYKKLDDKHTKFFQEKHFNKFQFRCGRIIQGCFMNDYDYQTFAVSKVTKTYIEAYPIYYDGRCGDVRKFNKPSQFKRFVYNL